MLQAFQVEKLLSLLVAQKEKASKQALTFQKGALDLREGINIYPNDENGKF